MKNSFILSFVLLGAFNISYANDEKELGRVGSYIASSNSKVCMMSEVLVNGHKLAGIFNEGSDLNGRKLARVRTDRGAISHLAIQLEVYVQEAPVLLEKLAIKHKELLGLYSVDKEIAKKAVRFSEVEIQRLEEQLSINEPSVFFFMAMGYEAKLDTCVSDFAKSGIDTSLVVTESDIYATAPIPGGSLGGGVDLKFSNTRPWTLPYSCKPLIPGQFPVAEGSSLAKALRPKQEGAAQESFDHYLKAGSIFDVNTHIISCMLFQSEIESGRSKIKSSYFEFAKAKMESLFGKDKKVELYNFDLIEGLKEEDVLKVFFSNRGNDFLSINLIRDEIKSENSHFSKVELGEINKQPFPVIVNKGSDFEGKKLSRQRVDRGALSQLEVQFFLQPENEAIKNLADFYKDFLGEVDKSLIKADEKVFSEGEIEDLREKLKRNKASAFFLTFSEHKNKTSLRSALNNFASRGIDTSFILSLEKKLYVTAPVEGLSINGFSDFSNTRPWSISHVEKPVYEGQYKIHDASSFGKKIQLSHLAYQKPDRYDANSNVISCLILTKYGYSDEKKGLDNEVAIKKLSELYPEIKNVIVFSLDVWFKDLL